MTDERRGAWISEIENEERLFREGRGFLGVDCGSDNNPLSERGHVGCGQSLTSGPSCVKQRPNHPNSAAQTAVLRHIVLSQYAGLPPTPGFSGRLIGEGARARAAALELLMHTSEIPFVFGSGWAVAAIQRQWVAGVAY